MPDIQVTDQLDKPVPDVKVDLSHPSSLLKYLKAEALHLAVLPDFLERKNKILTQAATKPLKFDAKAQHAFEIGSNNPEISLTPQGENVIRVNASPSTDLFADAFHLPATVPPQTGYVSIGFTGSLDLGVAGGAGDLTFGVDANASIGLEYWKAFPLGANEPTLGAALGQTFSSFVIPATVADLELLGINDVATISGQGNLQVSGGVAVSAIPNPLASANLPLGVGTVAVNAGPMASFDASFAISGSYQLRAVRKSSSTFELSFSPQRGTTLEADFSASAGVSATLANNDLIAAFLGLISTDPTKDQAALASLRPDETASFKAAIKSGLDHSLQASFDLTLSTLTDDHAAFQYEVQPAQLDPQGTRAIERALHGDLTLLTRLEERAKADGILAPGLKMLNSIFSQTRERGANLKVNLLGIVNFESLAELIRNSEFLTDTVTGDITINETVTGNRISSLSTPFDKHEALRKVLFNSVLATTTYRAGKAVDLPQLSCDQVHFALNQNTNQQTLRDYLNWFVALNLLTQNEAEALIAKSATGGLSTCVLRASLGDSECTSMFLDANGSARPKQDYYEIGRRAMRALLDPHDNANDRLRYKIVDDSLWPKALTTGATLELGPLVGLERNNPLVEFLIGDVLQIKSWAQDMAKTAELVQDMRAFVRNLDPANLRGNREFTAKRERLQKSLAAIVSNSKLRFEEPWGMLCLYWAAGSPQTTYAKLVSPRIALERGAQRKRAVSAR